MKNVLIGIAITIAISIGAVVVIAMIAGRDIPPPDTSDLALERPNVLPEENAYTYFSSATNEFYCPSNLVVVSDYLDGQSVDLKALTEIILKNEKTLDLVNRGIQCRTCLTPEVTGFETLLPYLAPWRNFGRVLAAKTKYDRLAGQYNDATDACISLLRFGDLIQRDAECLINYLVGIAVLDMGLTQARDLARDTRTPANELTRLSSCLANIGSLVPGLVRAIKVEYKLAAKTTDQLHDGRLGISDVVSMGGGRTSSLLKGRRMPGYFFQPNKTKLTFANLYRNMITNAPLAYAEMDRTDAMEALGMNESRMRLLARPNALGRILYSMLVPALDRLLEHKCRAKCSVEATRIMAAVALFRKQNARLPEALSELVPKYLSSVPNDPFDGHPFRYIPEDGAIYSVGSDLKDSGGSSVVADCDEDVRPSRRRWKAADAVFKMNKGTEPEN